ncbi:unnamed protein product [Mesocestoides corti]|uniref:SCP domain-containing protein n=1 Tax=Mesocestoides corti TaxID=53468 RepID=A0A158QSS2_MESCO|nr:unnamed protein product [Mesocestoides corti]
MIKKAGAYGVVFAGIILLLRVVLAEELDAMRIVTRHQQYRSLTQAADMKKLTWSTNLERLAKSIVETCPERVEEVRSLPELKDFGANLGSAPYPAPVQEGYVEDIQTSIIDKWGFERSYYYPNGGCPNQGCDSWWQIVWSIASEVGCSITVCEDRSVMVCIYDSRADITADAPFKSGKACSACPIGYELCENNMCVPGEATTTEPEFQTSVFPTTTDQPYVHGRDDGANRLTVLLTASLLVLLQLLVLT